MRPAGLGLRGLLVAAVMLLSLLVSRWQTLAAAPAGGAEIARPAVACVDPKATYVLTGTRPSRRNARWRAGVGRRGRCFAVQPGEHWERIYGVGGLTLMRRTPPQPGVPPLFFRDSALSGAASVPLPTLRPPGSQAPAPHGRGRPGRVRQRHRDLARAQVAVETLPPLPASSAPASPGAVSGAAPGLPLGAAPALVLGTAQAGAGAPAVQPAQVPRSSPRRSPPPASAEVVAASARGYAIGFALAILLILMSLAAVALLARVLLRAPRRPPPPPPPEAPWLGVPTRSLPAALPRAVAPPPPLAMLQPAGSRALPGILCLGEDETDSRLHCAVLLREAGWDVSSRPPGRGPDLIARRRGRVVALRCLPASGLVDEQAVEAACVARERVRADLAVIVSNARCTSDARQLASRIGVDLLQEDQLPGFAA